MTTAEYRVDIKVRNNALLYRLEKGGYNSIGEFCRLNDVMKYVSDLTAIVNMTRSPLTFRGEFRPSLEYIAAKLGCSPFDLFSDTQLNTVLKSNRRSLEVNEAEMRFMLDSENNQKLLEDTISDEQRAFSVEKALDTLTPREAEVLRMRNGLGEYERSYTLEECGVKFNVTKERLRQIEARALRKLRHPSRAEKLKEFLNE